MKKWIALLILAPLFATAQQTGQKLKKAIELHMARTTDDDMPGTRGASVVWHPIQKKYYAAFAGNMAYPLSIFDIKGKLLSDDQLSTMFDLRGLWFDPVSKTIRGNGYDESGWFSYKLNSKGVPTEATSVLEGMYQPDAQSVGAYDYLKKEVLFLHGDYVYRYNSTGDITDSVQLRWGQTKGSKAEPIDEEMVSVLYNTTSLIFTGVKGQEIGVLNYDAKTIELYNIVTGYMTRTLVLPDEATAEPTFNFSFANGIYWLFDMENRTWIGYK